MTSRTVTKTVNGHVPTKSTIKDLVRGPIAGFVRGVLPQPRSKEPPVSLRAISMRAESFQYKDGKSGLALDGEQIVGTIAAAVEEMALQDGKAVACLLASFWKTNRMRRKSSTLQKGLDTHVLLKFVQSHTGNKCNLAVVLFRRSSKPVNYTAQKPAVRGLVDLLVVVEQVNDDVVRVWPVCRSDYQRPAQDTSRASKTKSPPAGTGSCASSNVATLAGVELLLEEQVLFRNVETFQYSVSQDPSFLESLRKLSEIPLVSDSFQSIVSRFKGMPTLTSRPLQPFSISHLLKTENPLANWSCSRWTLSLRHNTTASLLDFKPAGTSEEVFKVVGVSKKITSIHLPVKVKVVPVDEKAGYTVIHGKFGFSIYANH